MVPPAAGLAVKKIAYMVRDDAVKEFGHLQPAVGPFPAWSPLKPETIRQKGSSGEGDPLIGHYPMDRGRRRRSAWRSGKRSIWPAPLRNTIEVEVKGLSALIGSADPLGPIHEFGAVGTGKSHSGVIPPRPFLRPALYKNIDKGREILGAAIGTTLKRM
jgi:phage gpG-like protein